MENYNNEFNSFTKYGPLFATILIVVSMHIWIFSNEPIRFLHGLVTPSIIIPMLLYMLIALIFGYCIGIIPTFITQQIFYKLIKNNLAEQTQGQVLYKGFLAGVIWSPLVLFSIFDEKWLMITAFFVFVVVIPSAMLCAHIEWRKSRNFQLSKLKNEDKGLK